MIKCGDCKFFVCINSENGLGYCLENFVDITCSTNEANCELNISINELINE